MKYSLSQVAGQLQVKRDALLKLEESIPQLMHCAMHPSGERYDEADFKLLREKLIEVYSQGMTLGQYLQSIATPTQKNKTQKTTSKQAEDRGADSILGEKTRRESEVETGEGPAYEWYSNKLYAEAQGQMALPFSLADDNLPEARSFLLVDDNQGEEPANSRQAPNPDAEHDIGPSIGKEETNPARSEQAGVALDALIGQAEELKQSLDHTHAPSPKEKSQSPSGLWRKLTMLEEIAGNPCNLSDELAGLSAILKNAKKVGA